jgi:hypothetical protein
MQTWPHDPTTSLTPEVITLPGETASICDGLNEAALSQQGPHGKPHLECVPGPEDERRCAELLSRRFRGQSQLSLQAKSVNWDVKRR